MEMKQKTEKSQLSHTQGEEKKQVNITHSDSQDINIYIKKNVDMILQ